LAQVLMKFCLGLACHAAAVSGSVSPPASVIHQEISLLQDAVRLTEQKLTMLRDLQSDVTGMAGVSVPNASQTLLGLLPGSASPKDFITTTGVVQLDRPASFARFLPLKNNRGSASSGKSSSSSLPPLPTGLFVSVDSSGQATLYTPTGVRVKEFHLGHETTQIATSVGQDEHLILGASQSGSISCHVVRVRQGRLSQSERQARRNSTDERISQFLGVIPNVTVTADKSLELPSGTPEVTDMAVTTQRGSKHFVVADSDGGIAVFARNGTLRGRFFPETPSAPGGVRGLYATFGALLFWSKSAVGFVSAPGLAAPPLRCAEFAAGGGVASAAIDATSSNRLYVALNDGSVASYNAKDRDACSFEVFLPQVAQRPLRLEPFRGYMLAIAEGAPAELHAYNLSARGRGADAPPPTVNAAFHWDLARVGQVAVLRKTSGCDHAAFVREDNVLVLSEMLFKPVAAPVADEFSDMRTPVILLAVVLVVGYQYMKNKKGGSGKSWLASKSRGLGGASRRGGLGALARKRK